jgi:hypothetical protein
MIGTGQATQGIPYWKEKLQILRNVLGAYTDADIVDIVYSDESQLAWQVKDNLRKWHKHRPRRRDGPRIFFDALAETLGCDPEISGVMLIEATLEQFISYLPQNAREAINKKSQGETVELQALFDAAVAKTIAPDLTRPPGITNAISSDLDFLSNAKVPRAAASALQTFGSMMVRKRGYIESIDADIRKGQINQQHYYLTPDAAATWSNLVRAEAYPTYDQCKSGLRTMVETQVWREAIVEAKPSSIVMLAGGGAPTKDLVILHSVLNLISAERDVLNYFIVDNSPYMLLTSIWWLEESLPTVIGGERVKLKPVWHDVLDLYNYRSTFRNGGGAVFGITGGTIGNLGEQDFFDSLDAVSEPGDLLFVSADTLDNMPIDSLESDLITKYNNSAMRRFVSPGVRSVIGNLDLSESLSSAFSRIKTELRAGKEQHLSDVENTRSITLTLDVDNRELILLSSTRYQSDKLVSFASEFGGWEPISSIPSPLNPHFVQFLFRRNKKEIIRSRRRQR